MNADSTPAYVEHISNVMVVRMNDEMVDHVINERVKFELHFMIEEAENPRMVLDCRELSVVNSSIIGVIMSLSLKLRRRDGKLRLCAMSPFVKEVFALTQLNKILEVDESLDHSIESLR